MATCSDQTKSCRQHPQIITSSALPRRAENRQCAKITIVRACATLWQLEQWMDATYNYSKRNSSTKNGMSGDDIYEWLCSAMAIELKHNSDRFNLLIRS